ncbi:hypothetical protein CSOJ01_05977 [Colletotrichum sojae]|uniref:Uncharacterized protein n=1 Tax=Colletotrichum sojae TaxID=2175907 RepID=A0A8H6MWQ0_9PEZI|nr:hypothetical protein CSOJ01_05977 [Colletotrichum sojae]
MSKGTFTTDSEDSDLSSEGDPLLKSERALVKRTPLELRFISPPALTSAPHPGTISFGIDLFHMLCSRSLPIFKFGFDRDHEHLVVEKDVEEWLTPSYSYEEDSSDNHTWTDFMLETVLQGAALSGAGVMCLYDSYYFDEEDSGDDNAWTSTVLSTLSKSFGLPETGESGLYDRSNAGYQQLTGDDTTAHKALLSPENSIPSEILRLVENPSPGVFFISMLAYGAGVATIYNLHRRDRYQDAALAVGITTAFGVASILGKDARSIFLRILPFSVLAILAVSAVAHQLARRRGFSKASIRTDVRSNLNVARETPFL